MRSALFSVFLAVPLAAGSAARPGPTADGLVARFDQEKAPAWADGDTATFFHRGEADRVVLLVGGDRKQLKRLPESDIWVLALDFPGLEEGVLTYVLLPRKAGEADVSPGEKLPVRTYRGPKAPPAPPKSDKLAGRVVPHEFDSKGLGGKRGVRVYLPPGYDKTKAYPTVFATDGRTYEAVTDALVAAGAVRPVVVVAAEPGPYRGDRAKGYDPKADLRMLEYLPGEDAGRFAAHERFFAGELVAWAVKEFGASKDAKDRAVFGCSNGARFAVEMGLKHPDVFGHVWAFSVAGRPPEEVPAAAAGVRFRLAAGRWEKGFLKTTRATADALRAAKVGVELAERAAGHDDAMWQGEWAAALAATFGPTK